MATTKHARKAGTKSEVKGSAAGSSGKKSAARQVPGRKVAPAAARNADASSNSRAGSKAKKPTVRRLAASEASGTGSVSANGATLAFRDGSKGGTIVGLLKLKDGATITELTKATGWQAHSVRGFLSGALKKKAGLTVASEKGDDGERRYRIAS